MWFLSFFFLLASSFFLAYSQRSDIACLPYFHTWCGLSANLEFMSECAACGWLKIQDAKIAQKIAICAPLHNFVWLYLRNKLAYIDNRKNLLNSNTSSTSPHNMVNVSPLTAEIGSGVGGIPANINGFHVLASLLHRCCSTEVNQTLHNVWPSPAVVLCLDV